MLAMQINNEIARVVYSLGSSFTVPRLIKIAANLWQVIHPF
jgi:hypothetical protein